MSFIHASYFYNDGTANTFRRLANSAAKGNNVQCRMDVIKYLSTETATIKGSIEGIVNKINEKMTNDISTNKKMSVLRKKYLYSRNMTKTQELLKDLFRISKEENQKPSITVKNIYDRFSKFKDDNNIGFVNITNEMNSLLTLYTIVAIANKPSNAKKIINDSMETHRMSLSKLSKSGIPIKRFHDEAYNPLCKVAGLIEVATEDLKKLDIKHNQSIPDKYFDTYKKKFTEILTQEEGLANNCIDIINMTSSLGSAIYGPSSLIKNKYNPDFDIENDFFKNIKTIKKNVSEQDFKAELLFALKHREQFNTRYSLLIDTLYCNTGLVDILFESDNVNANLNYAVYFADQIYECSSSSNIINNSKLSIGPDFNLNANRFMPNFITASKIDNKQSSLYNRIDIKAARFTWSQLHPELPSNCIVINEKPYVVDSKGCFSEYQNKRKKVTF